MPAEIFGNQKMKNTLDQRLYAIVGRVRDATLIEDFGATQSQIDDARLVLGIPEPSSIRISSMDFAIAWQKASSAMERGE